MKESIVNAFSHRTLPESLTGTQLRNPTDTPVLEKFNEWALPISFLEHEYDLFSLIDGEAFCYFLPRTILSSFEQNRFKLRSIPTVIEWCLSY